MGVGAGVEVEVVLGRALGGATERLAPSPTSESTFWVRFALERQRWRPGENYF